MQKILLAEGAAVPVTLFFTIDRLEAIDKQKSLSIKVLSEMQNMLKYSYYWVLSVMRYLQDPVQLWYSNSSNIQLSMILKQNCRFKVKLFQHVRWCPWNLKYKINFMNIHRKRKMIFLYLKNEETFISHVSSYNSKPQMLHHCHE